MNRMKQILEGNDIELLLNEVISNVFHKGLIDISDSETLSLIKVYYPQIFALRDRDFTLYGIVLQRLVRAKNIKRANL